MTTILYRTRAVATGGRAGRARTEDGLLDVGLALPRELGGAGGATNPEQLFAAGYAACFENALLHVARLQKQSVRDTQVVAEVAIGPRADGGFGLAVALTVSGSGIDQDALQALVNQAHHVCPYSHAIRGNIDVGIIARAV